MIAFTVENEGERLDKILVARLSDFSRSQIQTMISEGAVTVDGASAKPGHRMKGGERVEVDIPEEEEQVIEPRDIPLNILYEDEAIVVLEKEAGMVVHPGIGNEDNTLVHALLWHYPDMVNMQDDPRADGRMGIVHRLDKDTSGVMVVAKHIDALVNLMGQFKDRTTEKTYLAMVERVPKTMVGRIDAPIGRDPKQRKRMGVVNGGKEAVTEFEVIDTDFRDGRALVRIIIETGRTHQIRVHMAFVGAPIIGDTVYGFNRQRIGLKRNFLHAHELSFDHPATGERMTFVSALPAGLQNTMDKLRLV